MKMGEKLTFVNFIKRITDGLVKIIFRQDVLEMWWVFWSNVWLLWSKGQETVALTIKKSLSVRFLFNFYAFIFILIWLLKIFSYKNIL